MFHFAFDSYWPITTSVLQGTGYANFEIVLEFFLGFDKYFYHMGMNLL